ncbi:hypothetical protein K438DRAFT_2025742 [Mycena galopus ATCC 62051]|nr:hypothetical protein K438DRAFT_2025742 [Mycena galopus ATCC 62051]
MKLCGFEADPVIIPVLPVATRAIFFCESIAAIPGLESASFEELRLETYRQSRVAIGTARPQPAFAPAVVIPPPSPRNVEMVDDVEVQDGKTLDPRKRPDPRKLQQKPIQTLKSARRRPPPSQQQWG